MWGHMWAYSFFRYSFTNELLNSPIIYEFKLIGLILYVCGKAVLISESIGFTPPTSPCSLKLGHCCQKQVSQASDCVPQNTGGCGFLSLLEKPAFSNLPSLDRTHPYFTYFFVSLSPISDVIFRKYLLSYKCDCYCSQYFDILCVAVWFCVHQTRCCPPWVWTSILCNI